MSASVNWPIPPDVVLEHRATTLTQAGPQDAPALFSVLDEDSVWTHVRGRPAEIADLTRTIAQARDLGRWMWVVRNAGEVVGTTSYLDVSVVDARLEIGFTAYASSVWGTTVNPACKLLLMSWAFEAGGFERVQLKTDIRNLRSQAAIERLGARQEGVLRCYQRRQDGSLRDTVMYSVLAQEWPAVRAGLLDRLAAPR
ncbi:MAG: GNAT family N-acetyltransferase [Actinomycetales bacterium]